MKYFKEFGATCVGELETELYTKKQLLNKIEEESWWFKEEKKVKILKFIENAVPGDVYENYIVCVNLNSNDEILIRVGDKVEPLKNIDFITGDCHRIGELLEVTVKNIDYFTINKNGYKLIEE